MQRFSGGSSGQQTLDFKRLYGPYNWHFRWYAEWLQKDPELVYPEVREAFEVTDTHVQFRFGDTTYRLVYKDKEGPPESNLDSISRSRDNLDETTVTPVTFFFKVDGHCVLGFEVRKSVTYAPDMPIFDEYMGEITTFIEGPWVTVVGEILQKVTLHEKAVRDKRNVPKLREEMKRFGL